MKKFRLFLRFEKEEKWLEQMAGQGWMLFCKFFFYHFQKVAPKTETIRIDYREMRSKKDFLDYCTLFEDSGWKHIAGTKSSGTQYFLKMSDDSTEDIFSDVRSRAGRYKRLADAWLSSAVIFTLLFLPLGIDFNKAFAPKEWYLTPGLWELKGISFWWAFLFETPFALMRGIGGLIPAVAILICVGLAIKYHIVRKRLLNEWGQN